ncbi:hypothetical protein IFM89_019497 [Coptis chinensis]|uniref:F-box domain-containing protein n=1 Tax=Coptis chinensis TaxID=261450 RepID=A0A835LJ27_9MAGN|nr:hypothetical protein IFM89_019497 [Coptis chinensis]
MPNASLNGEAVVDPSLHHQTIQSGESMINEDRISDLPDGLLDQIYSDIDIIEAIRSSLVSKRWRYLWKSLTFLNADCHTYYHHQGIPAAEFNDFVNKVLLFRDSSSTIQRYCFKYEKKIPVTESVKTVIQFTVPSDTPVLDLEFCSNTLRTIHLCPCLATSKQLTVLKLKMRKGSHGYGSPIAIFSLPESLSLPRLKTLHLQMLRFQGTDFVHNLFSSCPMLEILTIIKCELHKTDNVIFSAVQLKHLEIDELSAYCDMESNKKCKITVSATNLRTFVCRADISNEYSLQNLSSLVKADIDMRFPFSYEFEELELSSFAA